MKLSGPKFSTVYHCPAPLCTWAVQADDYEATAEDFTVRGNIVVLDTERLKAVARSRAFDIEEAVGDHMKESHPIWLAWLKLANKNVRAMWGK